MDQEQAFQQQEDSMKDRIHYIMEQKKMTQQEFAQKLGIAPASLSSIFTGRTKPTANHARAIHYAFPEISIQWLMFGEGDMLLSSSSKVGNKTNETASLPPNGELGLDFEGMQPANIPEYKATSPDQKPLQARASQPARAYDAGYSRVAELHVRKIKEIRVFYSDGTYESFVQSK